MTPADCFALIFDIRHAQDDDAALELLAEHDRALVAIADEAQATAVALARESVAAERAAFADLAARQFWRGVCAERAMCGGDRGLAIVAWLRLQLMPPSCAGARGTCTGARPRGARSPRSALWCTETMTVTL